MSTTIIRNGRVIDPANKRDEIGDLAPELDRGSVDRDVAEDRR